MRARFRVVFREYVTDPDDGDCLRRAKTVLADRLALEDGDLVLWLREAEVGRFASAVVRAVEVESVPGFRPREDPRRLRERHPNYGRPWSAEDDERLLALYRGGERDLTALGAEFGRQPSAVRSRLARLGLEQLL
ncbi:hypothetical protein ACH4PU_01875 [Streptomyces sp. NPDC021100]|uniref:hypothetical protein n=1 Tax=Streptomyces sp. NPDC021100 TaxID=3365114 RepID=UPI0037AEF0DF